MIAKSFILFCILITRLSELKAINQDYIFDSVSNAWLKFHVTPATWDEAKTQCGYEGAEIVTPLTSPIKDAILRLVSAGDPDEFTIFYGMFAHLYNGKYYTIEGARITGSITDENCDVWATGSTALRRVKCTDRYSYVCRKSTSLTYGCGNPNPGYTYDPVSRSCYKFHWQRRVWDSANQICQSEGANLVVSNSQLETAVLQTHFSRNPNTQLSLAFVGIRNRLDGRNWMAVDGLALEQTAFEWSPSEPNNARGDEWCGSFTRWGQLYDDSCASLNPFICERKIVVM